VAKLVDELKKQLKDFNIYTPYRRTHQNSNSNAPQDEIILKVTVVMIVLVNCSCLLANFISCPEQIYILCLMPLDF
jgi:hypothetical protein